MGTQIQISHDEAASYFPLPAAASEDSDAEVNNPDDLRLKQLGYKQELSRSLSAVANFSMAFSIISVLTGLTTLYGMGLRFGGPATMVYGWLLVGAMTMTVGVSMAEICSAFPTSGGLYFWSAMLCGHRWGPHASWLTGWAWYPFGHSKAHLKCGIPYRRLQMGFGRPKRGALYKRGSRGIHDEIVPIF